MELKLYHSKKEKNVYNNNDKTDRFPKKKCPPKKLIRNSWYTSTHYAILQYYTLYTVCTVYSVFVCIK